MRIYKYILIILSLLFLTHALSAQIKGKLELLADNKTYQVSIIPDINFSPPLSITNNAQITLIAPTGGLVITNLKSIKGEWQIASYVESPTENHSFSYYSISLGGQLNDLIFSSGVEIVLFTFENSAICIGNIAIIDNSTDPFIPPNSQNVNVGNLFSILGVGPINAYNSNAIQEVTCPGALDVSITLTANNLACFDDVTSIIIDIDGGEAPFIIKWTNTITQITDSIISNQVNTPITLQNILAGNYSIEIIDAKNGRAILSQTVNAPEQIDLNFNIVYSNCEESKDGVIEISDISGGVGDYSYEWSNGVLNSTLINNLGVDTYTVTVTDGNDCTFTKDAIVKMDGWIEMTADATDISCFGMNDGTISIGASGKNPPFTYAWEGNGVTGSTTNLSDLQVGTYNLTVTDATRICNQIQTIVIAEPVEVTASAIIDGLSICELETEGTLVVNEVLNNRGGVQYSLDGINFESNNRFTVSTGQSYTVTVEDQAGCTADIDIEVPSPSGLEINLPSNLTLRLGDDLQMDADFSATTNVTFNWSPADGLSCTDCPNPIATPTQTTSYTLTVSDDNGCIKEASVIVYLVTTRRVYTPNSFSPNGDGLNDLFTIFTSNDAISVNTLQILDRWGNRVYISPDNYVPSDEFNHGWNGKFNGQDAPEGVYVFYAEILFIDGKPEIFKGEVNLLR